LVFASGIEGQDASIVSPNLLVSSSTPSLFHAALLIATLGWNRQLARIHPVAPLRESAGLLLLQLI
jgi:hypothetical protein